MVVSILVVSLLEGIEDPHIDPPGKHRSCFPRHVPDDVLHHRLLTPEPVPSLVVLHPYGDAGGERVRGVLEEHKLTVQR